MARPDFDLLDLPPDPSCTGEPITVFYDTEFTDLKSDSDLLSIAFVAGDVNAELYIEIADANRANVSDFVHTEVLPLFGRFNPEVLTRNNAAVRIETWLDRLREGNRNRQVIMMSDSSWDWQHLCGLLGQLSGQASWSQALNVIGRTAQQIISEPSLMVSINEKIEAYHREHRLRHHALVDARALKAACQESNLVRPSPTNEGDEDGD
jgi:hypothetical protein